MRTAAPIGLTLLDILAYLSRAWSHGSRVRWLQEEGVHRYSVLHLRMPQGPYLFLLQCYLFACFREKVHESCRLFPKVATTIKQRRAGTSVKTSSCDREREVETIPRSRQGRLDDLSERLYSRTSLFGALLLSCFAVYKDSSA